MNKFKIGDKVVPIDKTRGNGLRSSAHWAMARDMNQPFLYVNSCGSEHVYACGYSKSTVSGDFFNEVDLILYEENTIDPNLPNITEGQAKIIEHLKESWGELTMIELHLSGDHWTSERNILNTIDPLEFIKAVTSGYNIVKTGLEWIATPDELELNGIIIRSNWDDWNKAKIEYRAQPSDSEHNRPFYINIKNDYTGFTIDDAKELKDYLIQKIEYLESE